MSPRSIRPFRPALSIRGTLHACHTLGLPPEAFCSPESIQRGRIEDLGLMDNHLDPFYQFWAPSPISVLALLWRTPRGGSSLSTPWRVSSAWELVLQQSRCGKAPLPRALQSSPGDQVEAALCGADRKSYLAWSCAPPCCLSDSCPDRTARAGISPGIWSLGCWPFKKPARTESPAISCGNRK